MSQSAILLLVTLVVSVAMAGEFLNLRVTPGLSTRGPGQTIRVSVVDNATEYRNKTFTDWFDYAEPFQYRWKNKKLYTKIVSVQPGQDNVVNVGGSSNINVRIPALGAGVKGTVLADPCFSSQFDQCEYGVDSETFTRIPSMLNSILSHPDTTFFGIFGDMFYDSDAILSDQFYSQLSRQALSTLFLTVPGNADYWVHDKPSEMLLNDSFANGFMQYYGADSVAGYRQWLSGSNVPYNFTVNPDAPGFLGFPGVDAAEQLRLRASEVESAAQLSDDLWRAFLPDRNNFNFYTVTGNIGWIGLSSVYYHDDQDDFYTEACAAMDAMKDVVDWIFFVGHWSKDDKGCPHGSETPNAYARIVQYPGCDKKQNQMKYFMGHTHCNEVYEENTGFLIGGFGKGNDNCDDFGIPFIDSTNGRLEILYFPLVDKDPGSSSSSSGQGQSAFDQLLACSNTPAGLSGCKYLATVWLNQTLG